MQGESGGRSLGTAALGCFAVRSCRLAGTGELAEVRRHCEDGECSERGRIISAFWEEKVLRCHCEQ